MKTLVGQSPALCTLRYTRIAFTGRLASMSRAEAARRVRSAGGEVVRCVTRRTTAVVVGMNGWPLLPDGTVSRALQRAEQLNRECGRVRILSELAFLELLGLRERPAASARSYSAEQVCDALGIDRPTLRRWGQLSLIRPVDGAYDFGDLASLRTIMELVARGVRPEVVAVSLHGLANVLPGTERPLAQLRIVEQNRRTILADLGDRLVGADGQLFLNFEADVPHAPGVTLSLDCDAGDPIENWFARAAALEEHERWSDAAQDYLRCLELRPAFAEAHFNLGNVYRALGEDERARAAYRAATGADPGLAAAWYNLADLLEERGDLHEAVDCLEKALGSDPEYADAHFNLALCLEKLGRVPEADRHWRSYLLLDPHSEWATIARDRVRSVP